MPIPLGILAVAGAGAAGGGNSFDLLQTTVLTTNTATVTFTGLGTYSNYKHLQLRITARSARSIGIDDFVFQINNNTTTSYNAHRLQGTGGAPQGQYDGNIDRIYAIPITDSTQATGNFGAQVWDFLDFSNTSKFKTVRMFGGMQAPVDAGNGVFYRIGLHSGLWRSTSAITEIDIFTQSASNLVTGSRFSLYGIK